MFLFRFVKLKYLMIKLGNFYGYSHRPHKELIQSFKNYDTPENENRKTAKFSHVFLVKFIRRNHKNP